MADYELKWYGGDLLKAIDAATPDALYAAAEALVAAAAAKAPRGGTGILAQSAYVANENKTTYRKDPQHNREAEIPPGGAVGGFAAFYARFIELGTRHAPAKPFMRPAFDELKNELGAIVAGEVGRAIDDDQR